MLENLIADFRSSGWIISAVVMMAAFGACWSVAVAIAEWRASKALEQQLLKHRDDDELQLILNEWRQFHDHPSIQATDRVFEKVANLLRQLGDSRSMRAYVDGMIRKRDHEGRIALIEKIVYITSR